MKLNFAKRVIAFGLCLAMLSTDIVSVNATEGTVSGGNLPKIEQETDKEANKTETVTEPEKVEGNTETAKDETTPKTDADKTETADQKQETVSAGDTVSSGDIIIPDEETPLDASMLYELEPVTVNGVTIRVSGPADAFADGTTIEATEVEPSETVIESIDSETAAVEKSVQKVRAFDINLICNGERVQPLNQRAISVKFEGDLIIPNEEEEVAVYHVDEKENLNDMSAEVVTETVSGNDAAEATPAVAMETTHFSTYVIVITGAASNYTITYKHFLDGKQFYKPSTEIVKPNAIKTYTDLETAGKTVGGDDYDISKIVVRQDEKDPITVDLNRGSTEKKINITTNTTIEITYTPVTKKQKYENEVVFYDYSVAASSGKIKIEQGSAVQSFENQGITYTSKEGRQWTIKYESGQAVLCLNNRNIFWYSQNDAIKNVTINNNTYSNFKYRGNKEFENIGSINNHMDNSSTYLGMGRYSDQAQGYENLKVSTGLKANCFEAGNATQKGWPIVPGIVAGLNGQNYSNVIWGDTLASGKITEPGYFTTNNFEDGTKTVYEDDFKLKFNQTGNRYELYSADGGAKYGETKVRCGKAEDYDENHYNKGDISGQFFPLDKVESAEFLEKYYDKYHNWYYGMRYDFTFKLGDYVGPLNYTFEGDDDLWVFVDGELVLDLGGIHKTYPSRYESSKRTISNTVDLWAKYFGVTASQRNEENWWERYLTESNVKYDPNHEYQITVLYMERGAYASSCYMDFTLPNVETKIVTNNYGKIEFTKKDSTTNAVLEGAGFTLYSDEACTVVAKHETFSNAQGKVQFDNLSADTYWMKETTTPTDYQDASTKKWRIVKTGETTVNNQTTLVYELKGDNGNTITEIKNDPEIKTLDITFKKIFRYDHSVVLKGAKFTLKKMNENGTIAFDDVIGTQTSGSDGKFTFTGLEEGYYFMEETEAPAGYRKPDAGVGLIIHIYKANNELVYEITTNNSAQLFYMLSGEDNLVKNVKDVSLTITKNWIGSDGLNMENPPVEKIQVELRKKLADGRDDQTVKNVVLEKSNGWTVTIDRLDFQADGGQWIYYIKEEPIDGFEVSYSNQDNAIKTATNTGWSVSLGITNTEVRGALTITKSVDKVELVHGKAVFNFKITCPDGSILYRTITFAEEVSNGATKTIRIDDLPLGDYTIQELTTLRYNCKTNQTLTQKVTADVEPDFAYTNAKEYEYFYSHADVKVNKVTFNRDSEGNITGSTISQLTESESDNK